MMRFEVRWARQLLAAFAPVGGSGLAPLPDEVDYERVMLRMRREATPLAALGLRVAVWIAALAPLWLWGKLANATIGALAVERRAELLRELLVHRVFAVRELTTLLKLCAAMALLGTPSVRARSGYDHLQPAAKVESGVRTRLPLLTEPAPPLRVWPSHDGVPAQVELPRERRSEAP